MHAARYLIALSLSVSAALASSRPSGLQPSSSLQGAGSPAEDVQRITIRLDEPARIGLPIWLYADLKFPLIARYPFSEELGYFGDNRIELKRDGQTVARHPGIGAFMAGFGSIAPPSSPENRLPLHLGFAIDRPGRYSVRWTRVGSELVRGAPPTIRERVLAESEWLDFDVIEARPAERENWIIATLAARPADAGRYIGDYLPSILAAASDRRVVQTVIDGMYSREPLIRDLALRAFQKFPNSVSVPVVMESLHQRGPVGGLAYFILRGRAHLFQDRRDEIVNTAVSFLRADDDGIVEGALQMLMFARGFDWRGETASLRSAESAVEAEAQALMMRGGSVARTLAAYVPESTSPATRERLLRQIEQESPEREQALIALTWIADPSDLSRLGDLLVQPSNADTRGTDLASLPRQLVRAYGDASIPYLQRALTDSPYVWVRTQSAEQLALKGKVEAFRFFLDAITANRGYRAELTNWLHNAFQLPTASESELTAFLNQRITDPRPPPTQESPLKSAIVRLQSRDASVRSTAARDLLDLAPQSVENTNNVGAYLIDDVIRKADQVSPESWFDAALILGRLRHLTTPRLALYLEREGAASALIELGEPGVSTLADVLLLGGPARRLLAAEVLGSIGTPSARDALTIALRAESEARVRQAIQTALSRLGERPPPAEIR